MVLPIGRRYTANSAVDKKFFIDSDVMVELIPCWNGPRGCLATDRILVEGMKVGYMYRDDPIGSYPDSGWRFFAGDESTPYLTDLRNSGAYDLNIICNYDPAIIGLLDAPIGSAFIRNEDDEWISSKVFNKPQLS